jgi:hypothetical protein
MSKKCSKCQEFKELDKFHNLKSSKDGKKGLCKLCTKLDTNTYYSANKDAILSRIDRDKAKANSKAFYKANKELVLDNLAIAYESNPDKFKLKSKEYYKKNQDKVQLKQSEYQRSKRRSNPIYRAACNIRWRTTAAFKGKGFTKNGSSKELVGLEFDELITYLGSLMTEGMTIEKLGKEIHIDHIIPLDSAKTEEELIKLCHYTNLQPLWAKDNLIKSNKIQN